MADIKITDLNLSTELGASDALVLVQNDTTLQISGLDVAQGVKTIADLADKAYVDAIVAGAPELLDTLNELAAAIGDDPNFGSSIKTILDSKLPTVNFGLEFWSALEGVTTFHIPEDTNLYFTEQRVLDVVTPLIPNSIFDLGVPDVGTPENIPGYLYYNGTDLSWRAVESGGSGGSGEFSGSYNDLTDKNGEGGPRSIALGYNAGKNQAIGTIAIGSNSGGGYIRNDDGSFLTGSEQESGAIAIGDMAGRDGQGANAVAIGSAAGVYQNIGAVAIGAGAGTNGEAQGDYAVAIGQQAGQSGQQIGAIAIGHNAGNRGWISNGGDGLDRIGQQAYAIAIGSIPDGNLDDYNDYQHANSISLNATGSRLVINQPGFYVDPIRSATATDYVTYYNTTTKEVTYGPAPTGGGGGGYDSDPVFDSVTTTDLNVKNIAFTGTGAVNITSGNDINFSAPGNITFNGDLLSEVAFSGNYNDLINKPSGGTVVWTDIISKPTFATVATSGSYNDLTNKPAATSWNSISNISNDQGPTRIALGRNAGGGSDAGGYGSYGGYGAYGGSSFAIAIGNSSGKTNQGGAAIGIGVATGYNNQGAGAIAIGLTAGNTSQGLSAIAIGESAGNTSQGNNSVAIGNTAGYTNQGINAVAIGKNAGKTNQPAGSIVINASGNELNGSAAGFYVDPIRSATATSYVTYYNPSTKEVTYGPAPTGGGGTDPTFDSVTATDLNVQNVTFTGTGAVTITSGNDLNLVAAGTIKFNGSEIVEKTTGSWTLVAGANTVSLTVPINGTYSIWVNGNIPNGIVTYTATVVVTNTNVPVVGSSYGWYYADGNALVLTAIPTQVVGTANNISTSTVATTTANVFTFGITNNSGSDQVVNWGYTKL